MARFQPLARAAIAEVLGREGAAAGRGLDSTSRPWSTTSCSRRPIRPSGHGWRPRRQPSACPSCTADWPRPTLGGGEDPAREPAPDGPALEVMELTGRPFSSFRGAMDAPVSRYRLTVLGLDPGADLLRARVAERVRPWPRRAWSRRSGGWPTGRCPGRPGRPSATRSCSTRWRGHADPRGAGGGRPADPGLRPPAAGLVSKGPAGAMEYPSSRAGADRPGPRVAREGLRRGVRQGARDRQRLRGCRGPGRPLRADS